MSMHALAPLRRPVPWVLALVAFAVVALTSDSEPRRGELRIATFNIEYYPQSEGQARRAVDVIRSLDAHLIALQEIRDPPHLQALVRRELGDTWRFTHVQHPFATGVLYDSAQFRLLSTTSYHETVVIPGLIPVYEARFARDAESDAQVWRVFVVHWKAGGENFPTRKRQLDAFEPILRAARASGERVVVLGDFNATGDADRERIRALGDATKMIWASHALSCTCFWQRQEDCVGSALDHVLTSIEWDDIEVRGGCAEGCPRTDRCPAWRKEVSDHCPVLVTLPG